MAKDENSSSIKLSPDEALTLRRIAETEQIELEKQEIKKRLNKKWYFLETETFLKWSVAGLAIGLLFFSTFRPMLRHETEIARLRSEVALLENQKLAQQNAIEKQLNEQRHQENEQRTTNLQTENEAIKGELAFLASDRENLQALLTKTEEVKKELAEGYTKLASDYNALAQKQQITEQERAQFASLARSASADVEALNSEIEELQRAIQGSEARVQLIHTQLDTREIRGKKIEVMHNEESKPTATKVGQQLADLGASVTFRSVSAISGPAPTLYYLGDSKQLAAQQIQKAIADIVEVTIARGEVDTFAAARPRPSPPTPSGLRAAPSNLRVIEASSPHPPSPPSNFRIVSTSDPDFRLMLL